MMKMYHATTIDKLKKMTEGKLGIGNKLIYLTTDKRFAYSFAWKRRVGRGNEAVVLMCEIDEDKAENYHKSYWRTRERPLIHGMIKPFKGEFIKESV